MINSFKPFICKGCNKLIIKPHKFSKEPELCIGCYQIKEAIKSNQCLGCGGKNPKEEYWGLCEKCFNKPQTEKDFEEAMMLEGMEKTQGWEAVEDYLDKQNSKVG